MQSTLEEAQAGIKIARRNINNLRYADNTTLMARKWRRNKKPLDESERGEWECWLKVQHSENEDHGIWSHQMGKQCKQCQTLFWGSKITVDGDCSHEIKRRLLLERKVMTNLDSIFKSRGITLPTKFRLVKAMVFPVVIYGYEGWTVKKTEHQRIDAFELWCWEKTLESPLDCQEIQPVHSKGDQSWVLFRRTDAQAETLVLWPPDAKSWLIGKDWCWEGLGAGREGDGRGWDGWMASPTWWTWVCVNSSSWWWTGRPGVLQFMGSQESDTIAWLKWTEVIPINSVYFSYFSAQLSPYFRTDLRKVQLKYTIVKI